MILQFIYRKYKKEIHDLMIQDLLLNIPNKVGKPAIEVVGPKRESVIKWLYYEANAVSRRNPVDFGNIERRNGILIMIQALISAFGNVTVAEEVKIEKKDITKTPDWIEGINKFKSVAQTPKKE